ncbi:shikimate kinase [Paenibacillus kobensis]|uniref:shikimate kinase n=1 Tax=Paenibacillus kobensis TaxID=59841 RepID=UPI000FDC17EF|nr:shikimate kinase [Paenibacillus kobensis]
MERKESRNIVFIGMSTCGKSTIGALIAKEQVMAFVDTDLLIEERYGKPLGQLLQESGTDKFLEQESDVLCSLAYSNACISTGGSAVYSEQAMTHLKRTADVIYLNLSFSGIQQRLAAIDIKSRGIVASGGKSMLDVYNERKPLYERYADYTIEADDKSIDELAAEIVDLLNSR